MGILHRTVNREREDENRQDREAHDRRYMERLMKLALVAPVTSKGKGKKGKGKPRSPSQKGKGEGTGKARSKSAKGSRKGKSGKKGAGEKGLCANWVTLGSCARGAECGYRHDKPKNEEEAKYYRDMHTRISSRSNSLAPKGKGKGERNSWMASGACRTRRRRRRAGDDFHYQERVEEEIVEPNEEWRQRQHCCARGSPMEHWLCSRDGCQ